MSMRKNFLANTCAIFGSIVCLVSIAPSPSLADGDQPSPPSNYVEDKNAENALDLEEYPRAESLFRNGLNSKPSGVQEGYYRAGLGEALFAQGNFKDAGKEFKKAWSIIDKSEPAASDLRSRILDDLAWQAEGQNDRSSAIEYERQALAALRALPKVDPVHLCGVLEHLARLCKDAGQYTEAVGYYKDSVTVKTQVYGANSLQVADQKERVASLLRLLGKAAEATQMYNSAMQVKWNNNAIWTPYQPHAYYDNVVYRFYSAAPNCSRLSKNGQDMETTNIRGVSVSACINSLPKDLAKYSSVTISVVNETQTPIQLLPKPPELIALAPKVAIAHLVDASSLAANVQKKGEKSAKWTRFWGEGSTMPVTQTYIGNPGFWGYAPVTSYNYIPPIINRSGDMTMVTTQVPDYVAQQRAMQKAAEIEDRTREQAQTIRSSSLGPSTVPPGGSVSGSVYFDITKPQKGLVFVPVGNAVFEFSFPADQ